jgi:hypothetical protein
LPWFTFEESAEPVEAVSPEFFVLFEPFAGLLHRRGIHRAGDCASFFVAFDQPGPGEDVEMFHYRRQRHIERCCEFAHRQALSGGEPRQHSTPRTVGQRGEDKVEAVIAILNHLV